MRIVLNPNEDEVLSVCAETNDVHDPIRHIAHVSAQSTLFTFSHGWIKVEGDSVTMCPYIAGSKGKERTFNLLRIDRMDEK